MNITAHLLCASNQGYSNSISFPFFSSLLRKETCSSVSYEFSVLLTRHIFSSISLLESNGRQPETEGTFVLSELKSYYVREHS